MKNELKKWGLWKEPLGQLQAYQHLHQGSQKGEREQETENLFEKVMKENFPNLVKEIDIQVQEAQWVPNKMNPKRPTPGQLIIKMQKVKDKERIWKSEEKSSYLQGSSHKNVNRFLNRNFGGQKGLTRNIQSDVKQEPTTKITLPSKAII